MQAVIMAGGKGTRLHGITHDLIPKPMVPVGGMPLLERQIKCLKANGIDNVILVIGHLGEKIKEYFGNGENFGISVTYFEETEPLGTAGAFAELEDRLEENFILVFGDLLFDVDFQRMYRFHEEKQARATLFVHPNGHPYDSDLIISDSDCLVVRFDSKHNVRDYWYNNRVNAGIYVLNRSICKTLHKGQKQDLEKDVLQPMCAEGGVYAYCSPEYVKDVGTEERIAAAEKEIESGIVSTKNLKNKQRAIFLDRDGTLNVKKGLLYKEEELELEEGVAEAVNLINKSGYLAIVITNQPVVARGLCEIEDVENIHKKLETLLGREGAYLDEILFCPHHPDKGYPEENPLYKIPCKCRKPGIGLVEKCVPRYNIDLEESWFVGDSTIDIKTGENAGTKTALVETGDGGNDGKYDVNPTLTGQNLLSVVCKILNVAE